MKNAKSYTLITGGSEGIRLELAKQFAENGHHLILVARSEVQLQEAKSNLEGAGVEVITISKDLFNEEAPFELFDQVNGQGFKVDILVNNAGQATDYLKKRT